MAKRADGRHKANLGLTGKAPDFSAENALLKREMQERKRAEEALEQSEARFRNLYEHALAGIAVSDWDGRLQQCNPAFCALVGYSENELRGMHFSALVYPDDRDPNSDRGLRTGEVNAIEIENRTQILTGFTNNPLEAAKAHQEKRPPVWDSL